MKHIYLFIYLRFGGCTQGASAHGRQRVLILNRGEQDGKEEKEKRKGKQNSFESRPLGGLHYQFICLVIMSVFVFLFIS